MENENKKSFGKIFLDGLYLNNPVLSLFLGLTLAILATTYTQEALIIGILVFINLFLTELLVSLFRKSLTKEGAYIFAAVLAAGFSAMEGILIENEFANLLSTDLGYSWAIYTFVPFLATTSIVLKKSEEALSRPLSDTIADSLGSGLGYLLALVLIALCREILFTGAITFNGFDGETYGPILWDSSDFKISVMGKVFGGFFFTGLFSGIHGAIVNHIHKKESVAPATETKEEK